MESTSHNYISILIILSTLLHTTCCILDTPRLIVSADGSGTHSTIKQALDAAANHSTTPIKILIRNGTYPGHVVVPVWKSNIFLLGESSAGTIITAKRNISGYGTDETATFVVEAEGFVAQDLAILNTAGPEAGQAVAFRSEGDRTILHRCVVKGYQDTLFTQRGRHFFRDSQIYGTVDFIFGDSQAIFQNCILYFRIPPNAQTDVLTAQGRQYPNDVSAIVIHNCTLTAEPTSQEFTGGAYLGRPWKKYSRTVVMESFLDSVINPEGWLAWQHENSSLSEVYYAEYNNRGPRKDTSTRLRCLGCKAINDRHEAEKFTVKSFIQGHKWIPAGIPYLADLIT